MAVLFLLLARFKGTACSCRGYGSVFVCLEAFVDAADVQFCSSPFMPLTERGRCAGRARSGLAFSWSFTSFRTLRAALVSFIAVSSLTTRLFRLLLLRSANAVRRTPSLRGPLCWLASVDRAGEDLLRCRLAFVCRAAGGRFSSRILKVRRGR